MSTLCLPCSAPVLDRYQPLTRARATYPRDEFGETTMQLWLTFEELGGFLNCDAEGARDHVYANQWERRRDSDGVTHAALPPDAARAFMLKYAGGGLHTVEQSLAPVT